MVTTISGKPIPPKTLIRCPRCRILPGASFVLALALLATAGSSSQAAPESRFSMYVSVGGENRIALYTLDADTGELKANGSVKVDGPPGAMALGPNREFLYVGIRSEEGAVATFRIDAKTGGLSQVGSTPLIFNPVYLAIDHTGRYLLTSSYGAGKAAVYRINDDRTIARKPAHAVKTEKNPHSILMDRTNRYVFVPNTGAHSILQYKLDPERGRLLRNSPAKVPTDDGAGPRHLWFHPTLDVVYFVNETNSSVAAFELNASNGTLTPMQTLSTLPDGYDGESYCADIEVTPSGKFLYASNRGYHSIAGFAIDPSTGKLTSLGQTPTEEWPRSFNIDPTGGFLYAAGERSGKLVAYRIDGESGALDPLKTYEVGKGPAWVQIVELPGQ